jgi:flagellar biosynthesis protein
MSKRELRAAALHYDGDGGAPKVVAAGRGEIAATILARAREAGVPVHRDPELASALAQLALGQEIPEQMWTAVAQVLAWAYGLSEKRPTPNR